MPVRNIITANEEVILEKKPSVLRTKFTKVSLFNDRIEKVILDLRDTLRGDTLSVGLSAPQIGYTEAVAVINLSKDKSKENDIVLINPVVISQSGQRDTKYESCMSIPHKRGQVERRKKVTIRYQDITGKEKEMSATSFLARVILHEIDHLNGVLYTDRMGDEQTLEDTNLFKQHGVE